MSVEYHIIIIAKVRGRPDGYHKLLIQYKVAQVISGLASLLIYSVYLTLICMKSFRNDQNPEILGRKES